MSIAFKPKVPLVVPTVKRTADRSKYKVLLDGTPAPDCIKCKEKKR